MATRQKAGRRHDEGMTAGPLRIGPEYNASDPVSRPTKCLMGSKSAAHRPASPGDPQQENAEASAWLGYSARMPKLHSVAQCMARLLGWAWVAVAALPLAAQSSEGVSYSGWLDASGMASLESLEDQAAWEPFSGWKGWGYGPEPVWIRIQVPAAAEADAAPLVLIVRPPFIDRITFYDPAMGVIRHAGDFLPAREDALASTLFTFEVPALTHERQVFVKLQSTSVRLIHLSLLPLPEAHAYTRFVEWATALILTVSLIFCLWALVHWLITRETLMGVFALKQAIITIWGFMFFGFARVTVGHLFSEGVLSLISSMAVAGLAWSALWFFSVLLRDYQAYPWMLRSMQGCAIAIAGLSLISLTGQTQHVLQIVNSITPFLLLWFVLTLVVAPKPQTDPPVAKSGMLVYLMLYAFLNSLPVMTHVGWLKESPILFVGNMSILVLDGIIMLLILNMRQYRFRLQHRDIATQLLLEQEKAQLDQQHLSDQRQLLAMLAHEMKTPLANLSLWMEAGEEGRPVMKRAIEDMNRVIERCVHAGDVSVRP